MRYLSGFALIGVVLISLAAFGDQYSDYAAEVIDTQGGFYGYTLYDHPSAVLGRPSTYVEGYQDPLHRVKIIEPAYGVGETGQPVVTTIKTGESITVQFDHKVVDYPNNPYGQDLIVFGNAFFMHNTWGYVDDTANMNSWFLDDSAWVNAEEVIVSVSQDGVTWHAFDAGPFGDGLFPTSPFVWDRANACWLDEEANFTRPVDPTLLLSDFAGLTVADALDLYAGSAGGTSYDLQSLTDYEDLPVDPQTGLRWIQYVRLTGGFYGGEVDAVSDVAACGDPTHPYPDGDVNQDCRVGLDDVMAMAGQWLTVPAEQNPADLAPLKDNYVDWLDFAVLAGTWMDCTFECD